MSKKFDVSKIRAEVDSRKKERIDQHGERNGGAGSAPVSSMSFLRSLKESVVSGNPSSAVISKMKLVEQKAYEKSPIAPKPPSTNGRVLEDNYSAHITPSNNSPRPQRRQQLDENHEHGDREEQMYRQFDDRSSRNNGNVDQIVNEFYNKKPSQPQHHVGNGLMLNESAINDAIDNKFENYIAESAGPIMEAALKNTIIELYSKERVKKALVEMDLRAMVKDIVVETIKELQDRNKKTAHAAKA